MPRVRATPARAYLDYNATAPIRPEVRRAVEPILFGETEAGDFGNPSSIHWAGQAARKRLEAARISVARAFGRKPSEVIFTSGGSEADNLALLGTARSRVAISAVEHPAVMEASRRLEQLGTSVERIPVDGSGSLDLDALDRALRAGLDLVSVMAANNETGILSPIGEVIRRAHGAGALVHVDAVQAVGRIPLPDDADLLTLSGHKLGGLKGTGALIAREHVPIEPSILGGPQERGRRAGTESVAGAVALSTALEIALAERPDQMARLAALRDRIDAALEAIPKTLILGRNGPAPPKRRARSSMTSTATRCSKRSTSKASPLRADPPARAGASNPRTCCSRWGSNPAVPSPRCASRSALRQRPHRSSVWSLYFRGSWPR
jgi:cysteine desulfurase